MNATVKRSRVYTRKTGGSSSSRLALPPIQPTVSGDALLLATASPVKRVTRSSSSPSPSKDASSAGAALAPPSSSPRRLGSITNIPVVPAKSSSTSPPPAKRMRLATAPVTRSQTSPKKAGPSSSTAPRKQSTLASFFHPTSSSSSSTPSSSSSSAAKGKGKARAPVAPPLMQTLLAAPPPITTCAVCQMTYQPLSLEDQDAHKKHHKGVVSGLEWMGHLGRDKAEADVQEVVRSVELGKDKERIVGRIIRINGDVSGAGTVKKLLTLHALIDTHLSAPSLPPHIMSTSKTFVLLAPAPKSSASSAGSDRAPEVVVGACVVQQITSALRVLDPTDNDGTPTPTTAGVRPTDAGGGVFCDPTPLPATLGVHRIHTAANYKRRGVASLLLNTACRHAIFGHEVDKAAGEVAFSQPTPSGLALMKAWGGGEVRVFVEDAEPR